MNFNCFCYKLKFEFTDRDTIEGTNCCCAGLDGQICTRISPLHCSRSGASNSSQLFLSIAILLRIEALNMSCHWYLARLVLLKPIDCERPYFGVQIGYDFMQFEPAACWTSSVSHKNDQIAIRLAQLLLTTDDQINTVPKAVLRSSAVGLTRPIHSEK